MNNETLRQLLLECQLGDAIILDDPDFSDAFVGVSDDGRAIYSFDLMVEELIINSGMDREQAVEYLDFNTIGALASMGPKRPIILYPFE